MAVVVFDADVLIGFLNAADPHHQRARKVVAAALADGGRRLLCAVNYSEILIGPLRTGRQDVVEEMLVRFSIEVIRVDKALAQRAAAVRVRTNLKLPDAYALATAVHAERRNHPDVRLESFDDRVRRALEQVRRDELS